MYLPFLRGKLYELKAIKEYIAESYMRDSGRHIMPIIEPVKKDLKPLLSCVEVMGKVKMPFAIVLNSRIGDFQRISFDVGAFMSDIKVKDIIWTPAFEINSIGDIDNIKKIIKYYNFKDVMLIFFSNVDLDDNIVKSIVNNSAVKYIAAMNLIQRPLIISSLKDTNKDIINIEDCFPEKTPNNAYRDNLDEFFSDTFSFYKSLFGFFGFSDFTTLSRNYREGGVLPQVVAIHLTYKKSDKVINVHHFLSDSRNGSNNIRGEYSEAKAKIAPFYVGKTKTYAVTQISSRDYPGLGAIKKFSIKNHFELVSRLLQESVEGYN